MLSIERRDWGEVAGGQRVELYTLTEGDIVASVSTLGATLVSLHTPDKDGRVEDIVLGFDTPGEYAQPGPYFGCVVGRVANRIAKGKFSLDGTEYSLAVNNGPNHLHGGLQGFDKRLWAAEEVAGGVRFTLASADMEEGYPGAVTVSATYSLSGGNLRLDMEARSTAATPINLTNHSYFNLAGHASGSILDHTLLISADAYTELDENQIPTGNLAPVVSTCMDFTTTQVVGQRMAEQARQMGIPVTYDPLAGTWAQPLAPSAPGGAQSGTVLGFDHNYVLRGEGAAAGHLSLVADLSCQRSGRRLTIHSSAPGVQLYTANYVDGVEGKNRVVYAQHHGLCLETQHFPSSIGADPASPFGRGACPILRPGAVYSHQVVYRLSVMQAEAVDTAAFLPPAQGPDEAESA